MVGKAAAAAASPKFKSGEEGVGFWFDLQKSIFFFLFQNSTIQV